MGLDILLTGATGFIGRVTARALHHEGHSVSALVRGTNPAARLESMGVVARACAGELEDSEALRSAVRGAKVVVHAAAILGPQARADRQAIMRVNRELAVELARIARAEGVRRFVFISSIAAVGFWSGVADAESQCRPETGYGRAKRDVEIALRAMNDPDFEVVILRPPTVYGPGEPYNFLDWVRSVHRGHFRIIGSGANRFPLATTENVARVAVKSAEGRVPPGTYFVADREPYSLDRVHRAILSALGRTRPRLHIPVPLAVSAGVVNEALCLVAPRFPSFLSRARVRTLTVDQRLDVEPLLRAGVALDAPLEEWVKLTVADYWRRGALA